MSEKKVMICEKIAPGEVYLLYKDEDGIEYIGNKDGVALLER